MTNIREVNDESNKQPDEKPNPVFQSQITISSTQVRMADQPDAVTLNALLA